MAKRKRQSFDKKNYIKQKKSTLPTLLVTAALWSLLALIVYFLEPTAFGAVPLFLFLFFNALLFTFSIIFTNSRRGLLAAVVITIFVVMRYFGVGNVLNLVLLVGLAVSWEIYTSSRQKV